MKNRKQKMITWAGMDLENGFFQRFFNHFRDSYLDDMCPPFKTKCLKSCDLIISEKCNLKCRKCFSWKQDCSQEISFDECKYIVDSLSKLNKEKLEINLGGGEPLLFKDIFRLIKYCRKKGLEPAISTNATLITPNMAKQLADSGLVRLSISLDSLNAASHDFMTGVEGSYKKTRAGIDNILRVWEKGMLNIHAVLNQSNVENILNLVEFVNEEDKFSGINIQALSQPFYTPLVNEWYKLDEYCDLWPVNQRKVNETLDELARLKQNGYKLINPEHQFKVYKMYYENPQRFSRKFRCNLGDYNVTINSKGIAHLCPFKDGLCNVLEKPLEKLWYSYHSSKIRYDMYNCRRSCNNILNCYFEEENIDAVFCDKVGLDDKLEENDDKKILNGSVNVDFCNLLISPFCELECKTCLIGVRSKEKAQHFNENSLSLKNWRWIINELSALKKDQMKLYFSGDEPLLMDGIDSLIKFACEKNIYTMLGTSGAPLNKKRVKKLIKSKLNFLEFSIDSFDKNIHDVVKNRKGLLNQILKMAKLINNMNANMDMGISTLISGYNIKDILYFVDSVEKDSCFNSLYFQALVQPYDSKHCDFWYKDEKYSFLWPKQKQIVNNVFDELIARVKKGSTKIGNSAEQLKMYKYYYNQPESVNRFRCLPSSSSVTIDWLGYVSYCGAMGPIGNLKDFHLEDILNSQSAVDRFSEMQHCKRDCNQIGNLRFQDV